MFKFSSTSNDQNKDAVVSPHTAMEANTNADPNPNEKDAKTDSPLTADDESVKAYIAQFEDRADVIKSEHSGSLYFLLERLCNRAYSLLDAVEAMSDDLSPILTDLTEDNLNELDLRIYSTKLKSRILDNVSATATIIFLEDMLIKLNRALTLITSGTKL